MSKKNKLIISAVTTVALAILTFFILYLTGVIYIERKITDFKIFENLKQAPQSIEVDYDDGENKGNFTITDEAQIKEIYDIIVARKYVKQLNSPPPGAYQQVMVFKYDNKEDITLFSSGFKVDKSFYALKGSYDVEWYAVSALLYDIGLEQGKISKVGD